MVLLSGSAWLVSVRAARTASLGDTTAQLMIDIAPFQYAAAALLLLTAVMHGVLAVRAIAGRGGAGAPA
jgi:hypothetical protein